MCYNNFRRFVPSTKKVTPLGVTFLINIELYFRVRARSSGDAFRTRFERARKTSLLLNDDRPNRGSLREGAGFPTRREERLKESAALTIYDCKRSVCLYKDIMPRALSIRNAVAEMLTSRRKPRSERSSCDRSETFQKANDL